MRHVLIFGLAASAVYAQGVATEDTQSELVLRGAEIVAENRRISRRVELLVKDASKKGNIGWLATVMHRNLLIEDLVDLAELALARMRAATLSDDFVIMRLEYAQILVLDQQVRLYEQEVEVAMSGELADFAAGTTVEAAVDHNFEACAGVGAEDDRCGTFSEMDPADLQLHMPSFEPDPALIRFGIAGGLLTTATKWRVDLYDAPLVPTVAGIISFRLTNAWRLVVEPGLTIDRSSKNSGDQFGYLGLVEAQWLTGTTVSPLVGLHSVGLDLALAGGSYRLLAHGAHVGIAFPNDLISVVIRVLGGYETTSVGSALTMGGLLEVRAVGNSRLDRLVAEAEAARNKPAP